MSTGSFPAVEEVPDILTGLNVVGLPSDGSGRGSIRNIGIHERVYDELFRPQYVHNMFLL